MAKKSASETPLFTNPKERPAPAPAVRPTKQQVFNALWAACDSLRGPVDSTQYKDYILVFLFLKYLSDVWQERLEELRAQYGTDEVLIQRKLSRERFQLPPGCSFYDLVRQKKDPEIGQIINTVLEGIEVANPGKLTGVFRGVDFNNDHRLGEAKERNPRLEHLIDDFSKPELNFRPSVIGSADIIGDGYMYLTERFAAGSGKKGGEFYTPHEVSELVAKLMMPRAGERLYDPTCGSGSLLITVANEVRDDKGQPSRDFALYGQEINNETQALARMNMFLHGFDSARIERGDTIRNPLLIEDGKLMKFDVVVANPPFSADKWGADIAEAEKKAFNRFSRGLPPKSKGDYAFVLHMVESAAEGRGRVGVVVAHGVLFRAGTEGQIREKLIRENLLDAVVGLPGNLFFGTGIPAAILIFRKDRGKKTDVLFIDASRDFEAGKRQNRLLDDHIGRVVEAYRRYESVPRYAHRATFSELEANGFNLNIPRYVDTFIAEKTVDVAAAQHTIRDLESQLAEVSKELEGYLKELGIEL